MGEPRPVTLGLVQMRCGPDKAANLAHAVELVGRAAADGAQVVVLPELFCSPYFCRTHASHDVAEARRLHAEELAGGPTVPALAEAARLNRVVFVGGSVYERDGDRYFNTSAVFGRDGTLLGHYRKTHIPHDECYWEQSYFGFGDTGVRVFDTEFGRVAVLICYDQWFPEAAREAALRGAELIVYPTAIGDLDLYPKLGRANWQEMWTAAQVGHAACNNVFVAAVNRVGREDTTTFWGGSFVADPCGRVLNRAGVAEEILLVTCDLSLVRPVQEAWRFLPERRPERYGRLTDQCGD